MLSTKSFRSGIAPSQCLSGRGIVRGASRGHRGVHGQIGFVWPHNFDREQERWKSPEFRLRRFSVAFDEEGISQSGMAGIWALTPTADRSQRVSKRTSSWPMLFPFTRRKEASLSALMYSAQESALLTRQRCSTQLSHVPNALHAASRAGCVDPIRNEATRGIQTSQDQLVACPFSSCAGSTPRSKWLVKMDVFTILSPMW